MIYDSLDTIPYKLFYTILENEDYNLLCTSENKKEVDLKFVWDKLELDHNSRKEHKEDKNIFHLLKKIHLIKLKQKIILLSLDSLKTFYSEDVLNILKEHNIIVRDDSNENYHNDINIFEIQANELTDTIEQLSKGLPKIEEIEDDSDTLLKINKLLASYGLIVGYRIDPNTTSYNEVQAIEEAIEIKIKSSKLETNAK